MTPMAGLTIRGYARHRGVSHTGVRKALAGGRITLDEGGKIDPVLADQQWATSTNLSKPRNSVTGVPKKRRAPSAPSDPLRSPGIDGGRPGPPRLVLPHRHRVRYSRANKPFTAWAHQPRRSHG